MIKRPGEILTVLLLLFYFISPVPAGIPAFIDAFADYTLQNGMKVFVLEDTSSIPVRIEYTARAGVSAQTPETAGFFPLYARLFANAGRASCGQEAGNWLLSAADTSCNADSVRCIITVAPSQTERILDQLAHCAFAPVFSDAKLQTQYSALKTEVMNYAFSTAGFINSSIDARIFADAPWKQDTGVYPALFTNTPLAQVRTILSNIAHTYYIPQNSALFISGGITKKTALILAERTFGSWPAGTVYPQKNSSLYSEKKTSQQQQQRRFVIYDPVFSPDMTQIIVQYTGLPAVQADTAAALFSQAASSFKKSLLVHTDLAIRGKEYINAAAAHKNGQSRLIFQSILEKSETPPDKQAEIFLDCVKKAADNTDSTEFQQARQDLAAGFNSVYTSSPVIMDKLSELWAVENLSQASEDSETLISGLTGRLCRINDLDIEKLRTTYDNKEPFVFVLVNSSVYIQNADGFKKNGYETITQKNGSWYTQKLYKNVINSRTSDSSTDKDRTQDDVSRYIAGNDPQFSSFSLSNGIPVVLKQNNSSDTVLLMITINGGRISSAVDPGFFSMLINALAGNIQKEINRQKNNGLITEIPSVLAETDLTSGIITIESSSAEMNTVIPCISQALIYGDIQPSQADGLIYNARSQKRLYNGDTVNQLYSRAVCELFPSTAYITLFDSSSDILEHTKYTDVLESYPELLDASRYTIIATGRFNSDNLHSLLESSLGILQPQTKRENERPVIPVPQFSADKRITVPLRHLFITGTDTENAGQQPVVLVPTTTFSDPVQYWIPSPDPRSPDFPLFNALVYTFGSRLKKNAAALSPDITVKTDSASYGIQAAVITLTHVDHIRQADVLYEKTAGQLFKDAEEEAAWKKFSDEMICNWILNTLDGTQTNRGTAMLIHKGIEEGQNKEILQNARQYLNDYKTVSTAAQNNAVGLCSKYFSTAAPLRLYSKDAVK
ncbi:MAG: insulinase family protein [Treponema sp.]|nr:insulinase family protein [Treponema sp.]